MEPANQILTKLGGPVAVADILGVHRSTVYHWTWPQQRGGSGGVIPAKYVEPLVRYAQANGIKLKPADFAVRIEP